MVGRKQYIRSAWRQHRSELQRKHSYLASSNQIHQVIHTVTNTVKERPSMTTLTSPKDLLAAVPFLIGYHPENSIVVLALNEETIGMAMRIDYPEEVDPDQIDTLALHLVREEADSALLVAYVPDSVFDSEYLLSPIRDAIAMRGIMLRESLEVRGDRWRSTICDDEGCCPPEGNPMPSLEESHVAAEQIAQGNPMPFESVDDLRASIARTGRDEELDAELDHVKGIDYEGDDVLQLQREGALAVNDLVTEFAEKGISNNRKLIALVLVRLHDLQVRDYAMGIYDTENSETLWSMWRWLMRIAPAGYVAPVATLFAVTSYERGEGVLAQRALERTFDDDPKYPLGRLLRRSFAAGWPPSSFASMRAELHPKVVAKLFGTQE